MLLFILFIAVKSLIVVTPRYHLLNTYNNCNNPLYFYDYSLGLDNCIYDSSEGKFYTIQCDAANNAMNVLLWNVYDPYNPCKSDTFDTKSLTPMNYGCVQVGDYYQKYTCEFSYNPNEYIKIKLYRHQSSYTCYDIESIFDTEFIYDLYMKYDKCIPYDTSFIKISIVDSNVVLYTYADNLCENLITTLIYEGNRCYNNISPFDNCDIKFIFNKETTHTNIITSGYEYAIVNTVLIIINVVFGICFALSIIIGTIIIWKKINTSK